MKSFKSLEKRAQRFGSAKSERRRISLFTSSPPPPDSNHNTNCNKHNNVSTLNNDDNDNNYLIPSNPHSSLKPIHQDTDMTSMSPTMPILPTLKPDRLYNCNDTIRDDDSDIIPHTSPSDDRPIRRFTSINNKSPNHGSRTKTRVISSNSRASKRQAREEDDAQTPDEVDPPGENEEEDEEEDRSDQESTSSRSTWDYEPTDDDEEVSSNLKPRSSFRVRLRKRYHSHPPRREMLSPRVTTPDPLSDGSETSLMISPHKRPLIQSKTQKTPSRISAAAPEEPENNDTLEKNPTSTTDSSCKQPSPSKGNDKSSNTNTATPPPTVIEKKRKRVGAFVRGTGRWKQFKDRLHYQIPRLKRIIAHILETDLSISTSFLAHDIKNKFLYPTYTFKHGYKFVGPREILDLFEKRAADIPRDIWNIIPLLLKHKILRVLRSRTTILHLKRPKQQEFKKAEWIQRVNELQEGDDGWINELGPMQVIDEVRFNFKTTENAATTPKATRPAKRRRLTESSSSISSSNCNNLENDQSDDSDTPLLQKRCFVPSWALKCASLQTISARRATPETIQTDSPSPVIGAHSAETSTEYMVELPSPPPSCTRGSCEESRCMDTTTITDPPSPAPEHSGTSQEPVAMDVSSASSNSATTTTAAVSIPTPRPSSTPPPISTSSVFSTSMNKLNPLANKHAIPSSFNLPPANLTPITTSLPPLNQTSIFLHSFTSKDRISQEGNNPIDDRCCASCVLNKACHDGGCIEKGGGIGARKQPYAYDSSELEKLSGRKLQVQGKQMSPRQSVSVPPPVASASSGTQTASNVKLIDRGCSPIPTPSSTTPSIGVQVETAQIPLPSPLIFSCATQVECDLNPKPSTYSKTTQTYRPSVRCKSTQINPPKPSISTTSTQTTPRPPSTSTSTQTDFVIPPRRVTISKSDEEDQLKAKFLEQMVGIVHDFREVYKILTSVDSDSGSSSLIRRTQRAATNHMDMLNAKANEYYEKRQEKEERDKKVQQQQQQRRLR